MTPQNVTKIENQGKCSISMLSIPCKVTRAIKQSGVASKWIRGEKIFSRGGGVLILHSKQNLNINQDIQIKDIRESMNRL